MAENNVTGNRLMQWLSSPIDNSPLIVFRMLFGFLLFMHCITFISSGKVYENFIAPPFTFTYIGFEFLQPLPGNGMYYYFGLMAILGLLIMAGAWYRVAMPAFTALWTIIYLMQKSNYNNHYYLILLLCYLMCFMPANARFSIDARRKKKISNICPRWVSFIFIAQTAILYFYAAINKFTGDWLSGRFISIQFSRLSTHHIVGPLFGNHWFQLMICYGGILFDMFIVPLLLWKRTRSYALVLYILFHLFNSYSFRIGIFPYLSVAMVVFFLEPAWVRRFILRDKEPLNEPLTQFPTRSGANKIVGICIGFYLLLQIALPMRSWFYPGNVFWTEEGYRMSWKMMLRVKTGKIHFRIKDPVSGQHWVDDPAARFAPDHVMWISIAPDIAWQYAQRLKKEYTGKGYPQVQVYAIDSVVLNKSLPQLLIDTSIDLAAVKWQAFRHSDWILPYKKTTANSD